MWLQAHSQTAKLFLQRLRRILCPQSIDSVTLRPVTAIRPDANSSGEKSGPISEDVEHTKAIKGLLRSDLTAIALMESTFPDEPSLRNLPYKQRVQLSLVLKFGLQAYALGKDTHEADFWRAWELLRNKYDLS